MGLRGFPMFSTEREDDGGVQIIMTHMMQTSLLRLHRAVRDKKKYYFFRCRVVKRPAATRALNQMQLEVQEETGSDQLVQLYYCSIQNIPKLICVVCMYVYLYFYHFERSSFRIISNLAT